LSAAMPHIALFSASLALAVTKAGQAQTIALATAINVSIALAYRQAVLAARNEDAVTSVTVGLATSSSVLVLYYLYKRARFSGEVAALIVGDPLLVSPASVAFTVVGCALVLLFVLPFWKEHMIVGLDRDYAKITGLRATLYDLAYYALLAASSTLFIRTVGYILLHVLLLMPGSIAVLASPTLSQVMQVSAALALTVAAASLFLGIHADVSPTGLIGVLLIVIYAVASAYRRFSK